MLHLAKKSYTYFLHSVFLCSKRSYIFAGIVHDVNAMGNTENIDGHTYYVLCGKKVVDLPFFF